LAAASPATAGANNQTIEPRDLATVVKLLELPEPKPLDPNSAEYKKISETIDIAWKMLHDDENNPIEDTRKFEQFAKIAGEITASFMDSDLYKNMDAVKNQVGGEVHSADKALSIKAYGQLLETLEVRKITFEQLRDEYEQATGRDR
jgi:hypothetical protein